jgi:hypothetical protein
MATFKYIAPVVLAAISAALVGAAPAQAQQNCQFGGGLGPNAACASPPEDDDYSDFIYYPPGRRGFGYGSPGFFGGYGFFGDDALPGISAGPG